MTPNPIPAPNGCLWCGIDYQSHCWRYTRVAGRHPWIEPTDAQRLARLRLRRAARLERRAAEPPRSTP